MKRLVTLLVLGLAITGYSVIGVKQQTARPAGTSTLAGNYVNIVHDSGDGAVLGVDTFFSDTILIPDTSTYLKIIYAHGGVVLADSANDSVLIRVQTLMTNGALPAVVLFNDSFNLDGITTDAEAIRRIIKFDTLLENKIYFRTIIVDSFVCKSGGCVQNTKVNLTYTLLSKRSPADEL